MLQIIEENPRKKSPSVGARLNQGINQGIDFAAQISREREQKNKTELENKAIERLIGQDISGIQDPKIREKYVELALQKENKAAEFQGQYDLEAKKLAAGIKSPKELANEKASQQVKETGQKAFNGLAGLLKKGNLGFGANAIASLPLGKETQHDIGEFTSLTGGLEAMLVDMVSRGTLSNSRFSYIKDNLLPQPNDRHETIKGKLEGLAQILGLDDSELTGKKKANAEESSKKVRMYKDGKKFDIPEKHVAEAREDGYQ